MIIDDLLVYAKGRKSKYTGLRLSHDLISGPVRVLALVVASPRRQKPSVLGKLDSARVLPVRGT